MAETCEKALEIKSAPVGVRNLWDMFSSDKLVAVIILGGAKRNQATITIYNNSSKKTMQNQKHKNKNNHNQTSSGYLKIQKNNMRKKSTIIPK
jgi:hypothetical protein